MDNIVIRIRIFTILGLIAFCSHQMPDFSAKMHKIQFRLRLRPIPHWGSPLAGRVGAGYPLSKNLPPLSALRPGLDTAFSTILAHKPKSQTVYMCPRTPLLNWYPHFLDQRYAPGHRTLSSNNNNNIYLP